ncbi:hypothetical protein NL676_037065 [Syzygium grande]|nr:hypothetical protein NL676_037065 [Syzygium grande]
MQLLSSASKLLEEDVMQHLWDGPIGKKETDKTSRSDVRSGCSSSSKVFKMTPHEFLIALIRSSNNRDITSGSFDSTAGMSPTSNGGNSFTASSDREPYTHTVQ